MRCNNALVLPGVSTHLSGGNCAVRMSFLNNYGFFDECFYTYHDKELAWRMLFNGKIIAYNPKMKVNHNHNPSLYQWFRRGIVSFPYESKLKEKYQNGDPALVALLLSNYNVKLSEPLTVMESFFLKIQRIVTLIFQQYNLFKTSNNRL
jgi:GT2 family glycosyltransferase